MISIDQYFGRWMGEATDQQIENAVVLLEHCNRLGVKLGQLGVVFQTNPRTGSCVSGTMYGGFRPQDCAEGAPNSAHKQGQAVDFYDPHGTIDLTLMNNQNMLEEYGIYIEHPDATVGWSHWSTRKPMSGKHIFYP